MTRDRRKEFGLDPEGLLGRRCNTCGELVDVRTERDANGTRRYFCAKCGRALGTEAKGSFEAPEPDYPDA
jgi:DNA-directed RNA polymerase subunit RPC12/RpoP